MMVENNQVQVYDDAKSNSLDQNYFDCVSPPSLSKKQVQVQVRVQVSNNNHNNHVNQFCIVRDDDLVENDFFYCTR